MKRYEIMFILKPELSESKIDSEVEKIKNAVAKRNGRVDELNIWGRRQLAYPVKKFQEGVYLLGYFELAEKTPQELSKEWKLSSDILRFLILKKEK